MTSLEHQPNKSIPYLKVIIKLGLFCFVLSALVLGTVKILAKRKDSTPKITTEDPTLSETEKSIEELEKSEVFKKVFKKETDVFLPAKDITTKDAEALEEEASTLKVEPPSDVSVEVTPTTPPTETNAKTPIDLVAPENNQIFEFDETKNYQKIITSFIASRKLANLNAEELATIIITESQSVKINPIITTILISQESGFNRYAESADGRVGLLQIHPNEARLITKKIDLPFLGAISLYHPIYNIRLGLNLLLEKKDDLGSWNEAVKKLGKAKDAEQADQYLEKIIKECRELE